MPGSSEVPRRRILLPPRRDEAPPWLGNAATENGPPQAGPVEQLETVRLGDSARQVVTALCLGEQLDVRDRSPTPACRLP